MSLLLGNFTEVFITPLIVLCCAKSLQSCPALCDPVDCSLPSSSVHVILQARIPEWVAISFSIFYFGYSSFVCPLKVSISDKSLIPGSCKPVRYLFLSSKWNIILKDVSSAVSGYQCGKIDYGYVLLGQGEYKLGIRFSI